MISQELHSRSVKKTLNHRVTGKKEEIKRVEKTLSVTIGLMTYDMTHHLGKGIHLALQHHGTIHRLTGSSAGRLPALMPRIGKAKDQENTKSGSAVLLWPLPTPSGTIAGADGG